jgi:indole-3-glycerol phosphate synthase
MRVLSMTILDDIVRDKRDEVARRRLERPRGRLEDAVRVLPPARAFEAALRPGPGGVRVIAEIKKASPSRGVLNATLDPPALARVYADNGAAAVSVLTDETYFRGHLDVLVAVRQAVTVPLLRKDFTIDEYQVWEARAAGADAVLLIVSILGDGELADLRDAARGLDLGVLVEVHTRAELDRALGAGATVVGINNRDLRTFETRLDTTLELLSAIPAGVTVVSESGFFTADDVQKVVGAGAHAVLVGEALVRAPDPGAKLRELALGGREDAPGGREDAPGGREDAPGGREDAPGDAA